MSSNSTNGSQALPNLVHVPKGYAPLNSDGLQLANLAAWHMLLIGNSGILAALPEPGSSSQMGTAPNPIAVFERPWLQEPPGSVPFDEQGTLALSAGQLNTPILQMTVPQGFDGVIKWVSNNVLSATPAFVDGSGQVVWMITINGKAVRNFGNILTEKGTVTQGREVSPIRIFSGDIVRYVVGSSQIAGRTIASFTGYFYPSKGIS